MAVNYPLHHARPREFLAKGYWASCWDSWVPAALLPLLALCIAASIGALTWHVVFFAALIANANQVHRGSHGAPVPPTVRMLRRLRVRQGPRDHSRCHRGTFRSHYCVITPLVNPALDRFGFWPALEALRGAVGVRAQ